MAIREIVFDTETTGLSPNGGDRIVEIGCVEMFNHIPTGQSFHVYINPERDMPEGAFAVHGLSSEFLSDKPVFSAVADDFLTFIGDAKLVAHNASFDIGFVNAEIRRLGHPPIDAEQGRRHAAHLKAQAPLRQQQPRRAVRALRDRQFTPHQARRAARRGDPGRSLYGAARRPAGGSRLGDRGVRPRRVA